MLYYLSQALLEWSEGTVWADRLSALRLVRYITVRSAGAAITALALSWWLGPVVIAWLKRLKFGQDYADKAEEAGGMVARVLSKKGTPTMGGILIITVLNLTTLLWAQCNTLIQLTLLSVLGRRWGFTTIMRKSFSKVAVEPSRTSNFGSKDCLRYS
jgi:phospho-N-acetylmuramoyl-pentapeptide-transferase